MLLVSNFIISLGHQVVVNTTTLLLYLANSCDPGRFLQKTSDIILFAIRLSISPPCSMSLVNSRIEGPTLLGYLSKFVRYVYWIWAMIRKNKH